MNIIEEVIGMHSTLFATPESLDAALDRVVEYSKSSSDPATVMLCVQLVINAIAAQLKQAQASEPYTPYNTVNS